MISSNLLRQSSVFLSYAVPAGVILSDLIPAYQNGEPGDLWKKVKIIAALIIAQKVINYGVRRWVPYIESSGQFMIAFQCLSRVYYRDHRQKNSVYSTALVFLSAAFIGYTAYYHRNYRIVDLLAGACWGGVVGVIWNWKLDS